MRLIPTVAVFLAVPWSMACGGESPAGGSGRHRVWAEPATLAFGAVQAGEAGEATVLLRIEGRVPVRVRSVSLVTEVQGVELLESPAAIPAAGAAVRVGYRPARIGPLTGTVAIELDSRTTPRLELPLEGGCPGRTLDCAPLELDFGEVPLGSERVLYTACANTGYATDGRGYIGVGLLAGSPDLTVTPVGRDIPMGEGYEFAVRFAPSLVGPLDTTVEIRTDPEGLSPPVAVRGAGVASACQLELGQASVPVVPPGGTAVAALDVRNVGPNPCWIDGVSPAECGDFHFLDPRGAIRIEPGQTVNYLFRYRPGALGPASCEVALGTAVPVGATLSGECSYRDCLELGADTLDLGGFVLWTCPVEREARIVNRCEVPVPVSISLENEGPAAFALGEVPAALPPDAPSAIPLTFTPPGGETYRAGLRIADPEGDVGTVTLTGAGHDPSRFSYTLSSAASRVPPDALVVLDNGRTMAGLAERVRSELGGLFDALEIGNEVARVDHRLVVTTSGLAPDPACPADVHGGEDGRFVPVDGRRPRSIERMTPNLRATLEANLAVGSCHPAPAQPLEAALRALTPPLSSLYDDPRHPEANDGNRALLDESASRFLVLVSNRDDASPLPAQEYARQLAEAGVEEVLVIAGPAGTGCSLDGLSAAAGDRLAAFASAFAKHRLVSICDRPWRAQTLPPVIEAGCYLPCVPDTNLDGRVDDADVEVRVNGIRLYAADGDWYLDETTHGLCLGAEREGRWGDNVFSMSFTP